MAPILLLAVVVAAQKKAVLERQSTQQGRIPAAASKSVAALVRTPETMMAQTRARSSFPGGWPRALSFLCRMRAARKTQAAVDPWPLDSALAAPMGWVARS